MHRISDAAGHDDFDPTEPAYPEELTGGKWRLPGFLSLPLALAFGLIGSALSSVVRLPLYGVDLHLLMASVAAGQLFWGLALLICIIRGNIYARGHLYQSSFRLITYNVVKWGSVTIFLIADAFVLERAYERYFMFLR